MTVFKKSLLAGALLLASAGASIGTARADSKCGIEQGTVSILANDFPALHAVVDLSLIHI